MLAGLAMLFAFSLWSFGQFWYDKHQARTGGWRISESSLLLTALLGGWPGALLGRQLFRHKTRKQPFAALLLVIAALETGALIGWVAIGAPLPAGLAALSRGL